MGIDFNTELTEQIIKSEGCNYFCVNEDDYMFEVLVKRFHHNFFVNAFDVLLRVESDDFSVVKSYGTQFDETYLEASQDAL